MPLRGEKKEPGRVGLTDSFHLDAAESTPMVTVTEAHNTTNKTNIKVNTINNWTVCVE